MEQALLITRDDIVKKTALNGNVDTDLFIQFVKIAQDTHIQNYLGTDLLEKFESLITAGTLDDVANADYKALLLDYVKDMLIHWAMVEYLPFAAYSVANKGVFKHLSENSTNAEKFEVDFLVEKQRDIAQHYTQRFIDYICFNTSTFPEYNSNTNGDMHPDTDTNFSGWYI
jgi:hypothetical protein